MPWAAFQEGSQYCVYKLNADNDKTGESLGCHPSRDEAQKHVAALYAKTEKADYPWDDCMRDQMERYGDEDTARKVCGMIRAEYGGKASDADMKAIEKKLGVKHKAGARHSGNDNALIQKAHDMLCELGAKCAVPSGYGPMENKADSLHIFKDTSGAYRWISFSSSAFRDRDREIVSTKALNDDVMRADTDGDYGPLRFWHEPGIDLGSCDFNAMEGRMLVESGTFKTQEIAEALKEHADELGVSIGFTHPADEPDASGIFNHIRRFERSIVPADKASNLLTQFVVKDAGDAMEATKKTLLEKLIGAKLAAQFIGDAQSKQKDAEDKGVAFKETPAQPPVDAAVKADDKPDDKPAPFTAEMAKEMINKAFAEYEAKQSASKKEADEATLKATTELTETLKTIQSGQKELTEAVTLALTGVAELKGELPRKLGEKQTAFVPSQNGATPGEALKAAQAALAAGASELAGLPASPFAKFEQSILAGAQNMQQFVNLNQPQGN